MTILQSALILLIAFYGSFVLLILGMSASQRSK